MLLLSTIAYWSAAAAAVAAAIMCPKGLSLACSVVEGIGDVIPSVTRGISDEEFSLHARCFLAPTLVVVNPIVFPLQRKKMHGAAGTAM